MKDKGQLNEAIAKEISRSKSCHRNLVVYVLEQTWQCVYTGSFEYSLYILFGTFSNYTYQYSELKKENLFLYPTNNNSHYFFLGTWCSDFRVYIWSYNSVRVSLVVCRTLQKWGIESLHCGEVFEVNKRWV